MDPTNAPLEQPRYGKSTIFDRQTANFCAEGWSTLTWQVYLPGCSLARGTLKLTGTAYTYMSWSLRNTRVTLGISFSA